LMQGLYSPLKVDFNITSRCNYSCDFCYSSSVKDNKDEMTLDDIDKILCELKKLNVLQINISGGEPFVRRDILEVLEILKRYDFYYTLNTNGSLLNNEIIAKIKEVNFEYVGVSLDSANIENYEKNRGKAAKLENTKSNIEQLTKEGIKTLGQITLTKHNIDDVYETILLARDLGMSSLGLQIICPTQKKSENCMPTYEEWKKCFLELTELKRNNKIPIPININTTNESPIPWELYLPLKETDRLELLEEVWGISPENYEIARNISCVAGVFTCAISSNGDVFGCEMLFGNDELKAGNALIDNFKDIWDSKLQKIKLTSKTDLKGKCGTCKNDFCGGGCRGAAYYYQNDLEGSDLRCPL
jgi:AdoMet-dependent heme synthase